MFLTALRTGSSKGSARSFWGSFKTYITRGHEQKSVALRLLLDENRLIASFSGAPSLDLVTQLLQSDSIRGSDLASLLRQFRSIVKTATSQEVAVISLTA